MMRRRGRVRWFRFLRWLALFFLDKAGDAYVDAGYVNLRCPTCHTWTAETFGPAAVVERTDGHTSIKCARCRTSSVWDLDTPTPVCLS